MSSEFQGDVVLHPETRAASEQERAMSANDAKLAGLNSLGKTYDFGINEGTVGPALLMFIAMLKQGSSPMTPVSLQQPAASLP